MSFTRIDVCTPMSRSSPLHQCIAMCVQGMSIYGSVCVSASCAASTETYPCLCDIRMALGELHPCPPSSSLIVDTRCKADASSIGKVIDRVPWRVSTTTRSSPVNKDSHDFKNASPIIARLSGKPSPIPSTPPTHILHKVSH